MKKYLLLLLALIPSVALATPTSWDFTGGILQPLTSARSAEIKGSYFTATSTATSTLPRLTVTGLDVDSWFELASDGYFTSLLGAGLQKVGTTLTLNATGDWTGTIDGNNFAGGAIGQGDLLYGSAAGTISELAKDTNATRYLSNTGASNNPAWAQIVLTDGVTGVLPIANGGTNASSFLIPNTLVYYNGTSLVSTSTSPLYVDYVSATSTATSTFAGDVTLGLGKIFTGHAVRSDASDGLVIQSNNYTNVANFGSANSANTTFFGGVNIDGSTRLATSLTGVLQAISGTVSATSSISTAFVQGLSGTNSGDVTLAGALDYLTISGQVITRGAIDLAADVTGNLPVTNLNSGSSASASTFWRGDGTWATPAGSGVDGSGFAGALTSWSDSDTLTYTYTPTVNYITATGTTATSTFSGGLSIGVTSTGITGSERIVVADENGAKSDFSYKVAGAGWPTLSLGSSRNTIASPSSSTASDTLGELRMYGYAAGAYRNATKIIADIDGISPSMTGLAGKLSFLVSSSDSFTPTERMVIKSSGNIGMGTSSPYASLSVAGASGVVANLFTATSTVNASLFNIARFLTSLELPVNGTVDADGEFTLDLTSNQLKGYSNGAARVYGDGNFYPAFSWPPGGASPTTTTATTSIALGTAFVAETWNAVQCWSGAGNVPYQFSDGTNKMNSLQASTTVSQFTLSTNNTFTAQEKRFVEVGPMTASYISCTVSKSLTAD